MSHFWSAYPRTPIESRTKNLENQKFCLTRKKQDQPPMRHNYEHEVIHSLFDSMGGRGEMMRHNFERLLWVILGCRRWCYSYVTKKRAFCVTKFQTQEPRRGYVKAKMRSVSADACHGFEARWFSVSATHVWNCRHCTRSAASNRRVVVTITTLKFACGEINRAVLP